MSYSIDRFAALQDDEALLKDETLPPRKRMAVIVRLGEKRILRAARAQLDAEWPEGAAPAPAKAKRSRDGKESSSKGGKKAKVVQ
jgi:SET domain-containing protein 6